MKRRSYRRANPWLAAAIIAIAVDTSALGAAPRSGEPLTAPVAATSLTGWRAEIDRFASGLLKNPAWGYSHSKRDYSLARALADRDHATIDDDVLFAAAYLHDIGAFPPYAKQDVDHQDSAADQIGPILEKAGFPMSKLAAVQSAIRTHMYFREPQDPTATYLHDADGLDWLGAIGVARLTAMVSEDGSSPTGPEMVKQLQERLSSVPASIRSPAGRALLPAREEQLRAYLKTLADQTGDYSVL